MLRGELAVEWGELQDDLDEVNVMRFMRSFGRTFPIFETALQPFDQMGGSLYFDCIRLGVSALENAMGKIKAYEPPPKPSVAGFWWVPVVLIALVLGWFGGRQENQLKANLVKLGQDIAAVTTGKVLLSASVALVAAVFLGLFVNQIHSNGRRGKRQLAYAILMVLFGLATALIAKLA